MTPQVEIKSNDLNGHVKFAESEEKERMRRMEALLEMFGFLEALFQVHLCLIDFFYFYFFFFFIFFLLYFA